jgi:hypothetical protein
MELRAQFMRPSRVVARYKPASIAAAGDGALVADFGTNMAGIPWITVREAQGQTVELRPAEALDDAGRPDQTVTGQPHLYRYTARGDAPESWHPRFSYYGFRYAEISGARRPEDSGELPVLEALEALEISSCGPQTGHFKTSDELLNRIHDLVLRAIRSNLQSVMTDCPHREKLGWISDLGYMGPSFMDNYDLGAFYRKVLDDIADTQEPNGRVFTTAPLYLQSPGWSIYADSPEWGISYVLCPWMHYQRFGDERVLERHYKGMKAYCEYLAMRSDRGIISYGLSDWYDRGPAPAGHAQLTPDGVTATAVFYQGLRTMARVAEAVGKPRESARFAAAAEKIGAAFRKRFLDRATGRVATGSQTAQAMTLYLGLAPGLEDRVRDVLLGDIAARGDQFTAGNIGHRYLLLALHEAGRSDLVYKIHRRTDAPSYAYQVAHGATTLTEAWDCQKSSSQNHSMLGHIEEWFYECVAGLRPAEEARAYDALDIRPGFPEGLDFVEAAIETCRGRLASAWRRDPEGIRWHIEIPSGAVGRVRLPMGMDAWKEAGGQTEAIPKTSAGFALSGGGHELRLVCS